MAFGFFKKNETADIIFYNGQIYTQNPDLPWAEAVACKDGIIIGVGSYKNMETLKSKDTNLIDLDGKYLLPGFIDIHRSPVMKVFEGKYLDLSQCSSQEEVLENVTYWADENPDAEIIFGYGYRDDLKPKNSPHEKDGADECVESFIEDCEDNESLEESVEELAEHLERLFDPDTDTQEENVSDENNSDLEFSDSAKVLSTACDQKPVLLLAASGIDCWTNTVADKIIVETAAEEVVDIITVPYVLNLLLPFDFNAIEIQVKKEIEDLCDEGFTSVLNLQSPDYFESLYQDSLIGLYNEDEIRQRFFGSYMMNRPLLPKGLIHRLMNRKTTCLEIGDLINADMLYVYLDEEQCPVEFTQKALDTIIEQVADKGFSVFFEAINHEDLLKAYQACEHVRNKGYKNTLIIASDYTLDQEDKADLMFWESVCETWGTDLESENAFSSNFSSAEDGIHQLTTVAANVINMSDKLGTIKKGYLADFAIFSVNPLECNPKNILKLHADMTVLSGKIVYDAEEAAKDELYDMMLSQHY